MHDTVSGTCTHICPGMGSICTHFSLQHRRLLWPWESLGRTKRLHTCCLNHGSCICDGASGFTPEGVAGERSHSRLAGYWLLSWPLDVALGSLSYSVRGIVSCEEFHERACLCVSIHAYIRRNTYSLTLTLTLTLMYEHIHTLTHTYTHTYTYTHIRTSARAHTPTHPSIHTHTCRHAGMHAHTNAHRNS